MGRRVLTENGSIFVAKTKTGYITPAKKINKSCKICIYYSQTKTGGFKKHCKKFNISISSLNNATHCRCYERKS
jgi:hypothetical protein